MMVEWWSVVCRWWLQVIGPDRGGRKVQETDRTGRQSPPTETARGSPGELNSNQGESRRSQAEIREKSSSREGEAAELPSHPRDAKHRLAANTTPRLPVVLLPGPTNGCWRSVPCTDVIRSSHPTPKDQANSSPHHINLHLLTVYSDFIRWDIKTRRYRPQTVLLRKGSKADMQKTHNGLHYHPVLESEKRL